jgi:hypothetical protein
LLKNLVIPAARFRFAGRFMRDLSIICSSSYAGDLSVRQAIDRHRLQLNVGGKHKAGKRNVLALQCNRIAR